MNLILIDSQNNRLLIEHIKKHFYPIIHFQIELNFF